MRPACISGRPKSVCRRQLSDPTPGVNDISDQFSAFCLTPRVDEDSARGCTISRNLNPQTSDSRSVECVLHRGSRRRADLAKLIHLVPSERSHAIVDHVTKRVKKDRPSFV